MTELNMAQVRIDERFLHRINVREWGWPKLVMPGKIWRSEKDKTITCLTRCDAENFNVDTRRLEVVEPGGMQTIPESWSAAMWEYAQAYPSSACQLGPFLRITEEQRANFIRERAKLLMAKDSDLGVLLLAHEIGMFAAFDCEDLKPSPLPTVAETK